MEKQFGGSFVSFAGKNGIDSAIRAAGSGARGIVFVRNSGSRVGHFINVVNQKGVIRYLDGQSGKAFEFTRELDDFRLLRTN